MAANRMRLWHQFQDPDFVVQFKYPDPTPDGFEVKQKITKAGDVIRVHLSSPESSELYFELAGFHDGRDAATSRLHLIGENQDRFDEFAASDLKRTAVANLPAQTFTFRWRNGVRTAIFFRVGTITYRIIYNPLSSLNIELLSTVEVKSINK
jgi:hypothetical protein